ncbi:hypothetical protein SAMN05428984_3595 [Sphingomonas sp. OK281]|nr:hypothetical protein SAMN05428984_3595 [Sphingomonas sp. OK281]
MYRRNADMPDHPVGKPDVLAVDELKKPWADEAGRATRITDSGDRALGLQVLDPVPVDA